MAHTNTQANAEHKLQFLSAEYAKGAELEQVANEKKAMLEANSAKRHVCADGNFCTERL